MNLGHYFTTHDRVTMVLAVGSVSKVPQVTSVYLDLSDPKEALDNREDPVKMDRLGQSDHRDLLEDLDQQPRQFSHQFQTM